MWGPKQNKSITVRRPACEIGLSSRARRRLQQSDPLPTKRLHNRRQRLNPLAKPGQLLLGNPVMLRIASLDVRLLQLLEARTICLGFARPCIDKTTIHALLVRASTE